MGDFAVMTMSFALIAIITFISFQDLLNEFTTIKPLSANLEIETTIDPSKLKPTEQKLETKLELSEYYKTLQAIEDSVKALESELIEILDKLQKKTSGTIGKLQPDLATIDKAKQLVTKKYSYKVLSDYETLFSKFKARDIQFYSVLSKANIMINKLKDLNLRFERFQKETSYLTQINQVTKSISDLEKQLKDLPNKINKHLTDLKSQIDNISNTLDLTSNTKELDRIKGELEKLDWNAIKNN